MSKKTSFISKITKNRKWIILSVFLLLIIVSISATYIITYTSTKVIAFESDNPTSIKKSSFDDFDFDFYCTNFCKGLGDREGDDYKNKVDMVFKATISNPKEEYKYSSIKVTVAMGDEHWTNKYETSSSYTIYSSTYTTTTGSKEKTDITISDFEYNYPVRKLLFINIKNPTVYVKLTYTREKNTNSSSSKDFTYLFTYEYDEYIRTTSTESNPATIIG